MSAVDSAISRAPARSCTRGASAAAKWRRAIGPGCRVCVKIAILRPPRAFKRWRGLAGLTAQREEERMGDVRGGACGDDGAGLDWAGKDLRIPVEVGVAVGNNREKNEAMGG